ncbi:hypothetical protein, partial [Bradyrhizobium sp. 145]|uniref:hypothetical protein n=1 Tax=Bradyrhizobium sp. 145 TaxID=2782621 RepID=UPI001FF73540
MGDHDGLESVITIGWNTQSDGRRGQPLRAQQAQQGSVRRASLPARLPSLGRRNSLSSSRARYQCWSRSCCISHVGLRRHEADGGQFIVDSEGSQLDGEEREGRLLGPEANAHCGKIRKLPRVEIVADGIGKLRIAGPLVGESKQFDRHLAGVPLVISFPQDLERSSISCPREELVTIDEIGERHPLAPQ